MEHRELIEDAIAATTYCHTLEIERAPHGQRRIAELDAANKHRYVYHLNINHGMSHGSQAAKHQARYESLKRQS